MRVNRSRVGAMHALCLCMQEISKLYQKVSLVINFVHVFVVENEAGSIVFLVVFRMLSAEPSL